jgi:hypothetical protein
VLHLSGQLLMADLVPAAASLVAQRRPLGAEALHGVEEEMVETARREHEIRTMEEEEP